MLAPDLYFSLIFEILLAIYTSFLDAHQEKSLFFVV